MERAANRRTLDSPIDGGCDWLGFGLYKNEGVVVKLEDQVCSLELAKRLKALGVKQDSLWWWKDVGDEYFLFSHVYESKLPQDCSAFTVAELGELLPLQCLSGKSTHFPLIPSHRFICALEKKHQYATTEANARAKMLIWLKERGEI